jgi:hypothetical protein
MLIVRVYVNQTWIASATARNISNLADVSSYSCGSLTVPFPNRDEPLVDTDFEIEDHDRNQTVWALIEKMAARIAELEKEKQDEPDAARCDRDR